MNSADKLHAITRRFLPGSIFGCNKAVQDDCRGAKVPASLSLEKKEALQKGYFNLLSACLKYQSGNSDLSLVWRIKEKFGLGLSEKEREFLERLEYPNAYEIELKLFEDKGFFKNKKNLILRLAGTPLKETAIRERVQNFTPDELMLLLRLNFGPARDVQNTPREETVLNATRVVLADYLISGEIDSLLTSFSYNERLILGIKAASIAVELEKFEKAAGLLMEIVKQYSPSAFFKRRADGERINLLLEIHPLMEKLVPDLRTAGRSLFESAVLPVAPEKTPFSELPTQKLKKCKTPPPPFALDAEAIALRKRIRESKDLLLFTRNISQEELKDAAEKGEFRIINGRGIKQYRYGLGHEYGDIVVVMKMEFWEKEKNHPVENLFLPAEQKELSMEDFLEELTPKVNFNRALDVSHDLDVPWEAIGQSIKIFHKPSYMGLYPQLEIDHAVPLDDVEKILVPEHREEEIKELLRKNPRMRSLIQIVKETGKDKEEFLAGRDSLGRRSRERAGRLEPQFGEGAFFIFEKEYFKLVLDSFAARAGRLFDKYGYRGTPGGSWLFANPLSSKLQREEHDWKIFVNPRRENFFAVLEKTLEVLSGLKGGKPGFKIPLDLSREWRKGRKFGSSPSTPKITIYVNEESLSLIIKKLDEAFKKANLQEGGFGGAGPSFCRPYGGTDLLFYKKEFQYVNGEGDERASIANQFDKLEDKQKALFNAGFRGKNFYAKEGVYDPVPGQKIK